MPKTVAIVGAGPGGLAAAMLLAKAGLDVQVFERRSVVGGRTSPLGEGGFTFDLGPTFFLYPEILEQVFAACGLDVTDHLEMIRLDPHYRLTFGQGGTLTTTADPAAMEERVAALAPEDAKNVRRFLEDNRRKLAMFKKFMQRPFLGWSDLFSLPLAGSLSLVRPWSSVWKDLGRYFDDDRIRLTFTFQSKYLGMSPFSCPSVFSILSFLEYEYGIFHPKGGCSRVTRVMAEQAEALGARIALDEPVDSLLFDGRRAVGVRTKSGQEHRADAVVLNADFGHAMTTLIPDELRSRWTDGRLARKKFSCSTFMMYLGVDGSVPELDHHNIYLTTDYVRNLEEIEKLHVLSDNPSFYVQNACPTDPSLAPAGMSTLYVLFPVTHEHPNVDWSAERDRFRETAFRQLPKIGLDNIESRVRYERIVTPADWDSEYAVHLGATFNLAHSLDQLLHLRPRNRFEDLDSVYLVGGGTHPGTGLPVIFESARISSELLLDELGLDADWIRSEADA
jgi:phytoene desaturase